MNKFVSYVLAIFTFIAFIILVIYLQPNPFNINSLEPYSKLIGMGVVNTILVSIISLVGSLILGFVFYLLSISKSRYLVALDDVFTEIIYGTPLLVLIMIFAFVVGPAFDIYLRNIMGASALIVYMSPYMKNVYKSAISSIPDEQYMAMDLFGFTKFQRYRYIIIPQVIRILMPPMMNNFSMIIKGSALLNVVSYTELYYGIRVATSKTFAFVEGYIIMWVLYLLITIPLSQLTKYIERKWAI